MGVLLPFPKTLGKGVNGWSTWVWEEDGGPQSLEDPGGAAVVLLGSRGGGSLSDDGAS